MGRIELIIGCMYSGKTSQLLSLIKRYKSIKTNMMVINYLEDTRYGNDNKIYSHDKNSIEAIPLDNLNKLVTDSKYRDQYREAETIFINEGQFFDNLLEFTTNAANNDDKTIIICGLDGDYLRRPFGDILYLIPHADKVTRLEALCKICGDGTPGIFTKRIIKTEGQKLIGGDESYIPVCRNHYD